MKPTTAAARDVEAVSLEMGFGNGENPVTLSVGRYGAALDAAFAAGFTWYAANIGGGRWDSSNSWEGEDGQGSTRDRGEILGRAFKVQKPGVVPRVATVDRGTLNTGMHTAWLFGFYWAATLHVSERCA